MRISLFKTPKPRQFEYVPRFNSNGDKDPKRVVFRRKKHSGGSTIRSNIAIAMIFLLLIALSIILLT